MDTHKEEYQRARSAFDSLRVEDKAVFVLEAAVTTLARGIESAGAALADVVQQAFREAERKTAAEEGSPIAPEPPMPPPDAPNSGDTFSI